MNTFSEILSEAKNQKELGRNDPPVDGAVIWLSSDDVKPGLVSDWLNRADASYRLRCSSRKLISEFERFSNVLTVIATAILLALLGWLIGNP